jgi:PAS domain S-box-containing protein
MRTGDPGARSDRALDECKAHRSALREAQHMLELVLNTIPVRVFWKDLECVYLGCNRLFASDAGLEDPGQIVGRTDFELGWHDQAELYRADDRKVMESGVPKIGYEEPQTTPRGHRIWLRTSKIPLRDADGRIVGVLGTYEDITASKNAEEQQRELEAQMQHAQKLESLGILAGGIAHDFNNLLVAVLGHADLALDVAPPDAPSRPHLQEIRTAATRARELTNQMLAYSGKGRFVIERLNLNSVVEEMSHLLETSIPKKASMVRELAEGLPVVEVDVAQIRQVVMNLVTNAAESLTGEGRIVLRTGRGQRDGKTPVEPGSAQSLADGEYVVVEVEDDGCGMNKETQARLFEPFFTTKFQGRGLGLAAVLGIVRGHGGAIEVESEQGRGSTFRVLLPAQPAVALEPSPIEAAPSRGTVAGGTVLVVDDEESVRDVASRMLEREGYAVLLAGDGAEALRIFTGHADRIGLVLLDMTMPRKNGIETFAELRALDPAVRVVLTSGYDRQEATQELVDRGLAGFLQKPFTLEDLRTCLREALA